MDRQDVIKNIMSTYGKHGITEMVIDEQIDSGLESGLSYQTIYTGLRMVLGNTFNEREYFTPAEMAEALGATEKEIVQQIKQLGGELEAVGEDTSQYLTEIKSEAKQRFLVLPGGLR